MKKIFEYLTSPIVKSVIVPIFIGSLALAGCGKSKIKEPLKKDYEKDSEFELRSNGRIYTGKDLDEDGFIDVITEDFIGDNSSPRVRFIAEGYEEHDYVRRRSSLRRAIIMPKEMRNTATALLKADNTLEFQIDQAEYKQLQGGRE